MPRYVGTKKWFLDKPVPQQKDYLVKKPRSTFKEVHEEHKEQVETEADAEHKERLGKAHKRLENRIHKDVASMDLQAPTRLREIAATEREMKEVYSKCFRIMLKDGQKFMSRVQWLTTPDYSEVTIAFKIDMDSVPESLISDLVDCGTKNVRVEPCRDAFGGGLRPIR